MLFSNLILSALTLAGICSASARFQVRSPSTSGLLGFKYDKKPFFGGKCSETYDKYLKVQSSGEGVHFKLTGCTDEGYCHLYITDGDYKGYCLGGQERPESQSCTGYDNNIYKLNLDFTISTVGGLYLGIGNEYADDCDKFNYVKLSDEKFRWVIEKDKDFDEEDNYEDYEEYEYYHPRGGSQRIFHDCRNE
ncbi:uncharacterized protein B0P05DRAFT_567865 [Gilbertella persicaria]|uniref:uncharacterized protein n=1 Tax=Gilbertella persicaria TaxID=101096 RepID=UPI00221F290F|nr:uncharacterized protein B0P05DRAFT_567865 [Gilbertella persicaria]KAI8097884.1 hypothetical protein B0P05DRAFT_567865 [Gilbertella persicaria]